MTNNTDHIMLVRELGKIVKALGLLLSLNLLLHVLVLAGHGGEDVISVTSKLQDPQQVPEAFAAIFSDPMCGRLLFEAKRLVNQRVIDVGLVSGLESAKKDVDALEVGFQQSSIETRSASVVYIAKQLGRCKTRVVSFAAKLSDASKI